MQTETENSLREIRFTPEFKRNLRQLSKKYRRIRSDIQPILDDLSAGDLPGDEIQGVGFPVYKVRVRNSDAQREKAAGIGSFTTCQLRLQSF